MMDRSTLLGDLGPGYPYHILPFVYGYDATQILVTGDIGQNGDTSKMATTKTVVAVLVVTVLDVSLFWMCHHFG